MQITVLTQSSLRTYRNCPRQYLYAYELKLRRDRTSQPLRFGSAFHLGQELRIKHGDAEAIRLAAAQYDTVPQWADPFDWAVERETLRALLAGYFWRYQEDQIQVISTEGQWELPLINPETGSSSRTFCLAGKIDKIIIQDNGRLAIQEFKTCGEDISDDSDYWPRLRCDAQISAYVYAARRRGHNVDTVLYDVTRKPEISPRKIPVLDAEGFKIVRDEHGERVYNKNKKPRESALAENNWTLETTMESPEQFGVRLLADIGERPDFYFARREIPRLESDLNEFEEEVWQQALQLGQARKRGLWFRNVGMMTCRNCTYKEICLQNIEVDPASPPAGFVIADSANPELTGEFI